MDGFWQEYLLAAQKKNINLDEKQKDLLQKLNKIAQNFRKSTFLKWKKQKIHGLYLFGSVGTGKTTVIDLFLEQFAGQKQQMHFSNFMNFAHEELNKYQNHKNPLQKIIKQYFSEIRLLIIDEFEIFDIANAMLVGEILQNIFKKKILLIIISNITPKNLYKNGLQREKFLQTIDLIEKKMEITELSNDFDYREQKELDFEQRLFMNVDLQKQFADLYKKTQLRTLIIKKREILLPHCYENYCFLDFENDVCQKNLGNHDFTVISKTFSTIFLQNIPIFNDQNQDACTRFINFIDKIYLHKVKLFFSAQATLENLFHGGIKQKEFKRTLSRLREMQSKDYCK